MPASASSIWDRVLLRGLNIEPNGDMLVEYCIPSLDARQNGVILNHTLLVPMGADYDDELEAVQESILALIRDVLEDFPELEPLRLPQAADDEDDDDDDE